MTFLFLLVVCDLILLAVFNPAVGTGLLAVAGEGRGLWLYWLAPMTGGFLAGVMFHIVNTGEYDVALGKTTEMDVNSSAVGAHVGSYSMNISSQVISKDFNGRQSMMGLLKPNTIEEN